MTGLTDRQRKVLDFIIAHRARHECAPTLREIGAHMGIRSTNGVNDHLRALETKGYIARGTMQARSIRVVPPELRPEYRAEHQSPVQYDTASCPHCGSVVWRSAS